MQLADVLKFIQSKKLLQNEDIIEILPIEFSYSNNVYKIVTDKQTYYLRLARVNPNLSRNDEYLVLEQLHVKVYYYDQDGNQLRDWYPGDLVKQWNQQLLDALIKEVTNIHNLKQLNIDKFNHFKYDFYFKSSEYYSKYSKMYYELLLKHNALPSVVCHNDLNPNNILQSGQNIHIIDFEHVKLNTIYWEYANFGRENLNYKQLQYLCSRLNLDWNVFLDFLIITCIHALQWTLTIKTSEMITNYRKHVELRLEYFIKLLK